MTDRRDENDRARDGTLPADPAADARPALRLAKPGETPKYQEPNAVAAERALLGALLWAGANAPDTLRVSSVADLLPTGEPFFLRQNGDVYDAARACYEAKQEHDPVAVLGQLASKGRDRAAGGLEGLQTLLAEASTVSERQARVYAEQIRSAWARRSIILEARKLVEDARSPKIPVDELLSRMQTTQVTIVERAAVGSRSISIRESMAQFFRRLEMGGGEVFSTGFRDLDEAMNGGMRPGEVTLFAARTSVGKSLFSGQVAENVCAIDDSLCSLYVTLEMPHQSFSARLVAARSGVPLSRLRRPTVNGQSVLTPEQWARITAAVNELANRGVYFADSPTQTMMSILALAKERSTSLRLEGKRLGLVVIDYVGLIKPSAEVVKRKGTRESEVAETSRALKFIAQELNCHVMGLVQINREAEKNGDSIPKLHQLRDSGALEQDADTVLILHRERDGRTGAFKNNKPAALNMAKGRMDETRPMLLDYIPARTMFADYSGEKSFWDVYGSEG